MSTHPTIITLIVMFSLRHKINMTMYSDNWCKKLKVIYLNLILKCLSYELNLNTYSNL